jgi:hypothetical protein
VISDYPRDSGYIPVELWDGLVTLEDELGRTVFIKGYSVRRERNMSEEYPDALFVWVCGGSRPHEGDGIPMNYRNGRRFGSYVANNIYLYRYWPIELDEREIGIVLDAARTCTSAEMVAEMEERRAAAEREAFELFAVQRFDGELNEHRQHITIQERSVIEWRNMIAAAEQTMRERTELLDAVLRMREADNGVERLWHERTLVAEHPRVESLRFDAGSRQLIILTTDDLRLYRSDTGESRWLGQFEIRFQLGVPRIRMQNLSTPRGGRDHPHIIDNEPCLGGHRDSFNELLIRGEFYTLFELCLQYIETLNLADEYGRFGSYWFDIEDPRPIEVPQEAAVA